MAFIRKHRVVLVPLFVAVVLGLGAFFLLRSKSEEPAGDAREAARLGAPVWQEDVAARSAHGRELSRAQSPAGQAVPACTRGLFGNTSSLAKGKPSQSRICPTPSDNLPPGRPEFWASL